LSTHEPLAAQLDACTPTVDPAVPGADFFRARERLRTQALVDRDLDSIERLHAPEYELVTPAGRVFSRERYLGLIAAAPFYAAWEHGPMAVRISAAMAIVRYQARLTFPSGKVVDCWHSDSYELRAGEWVAVWSQATALPADPRP
jgi:hypothetical protein